MKDEISKNLKVNLLITIGTGVLGFILNKYFAKYMGIETLGLMKLFTQMVAYLSLAELGLGTASAYALYKPLAEKNIQQISIVVSTIDLFYRKIAILIIILGVISLVGLPFFIESNDFGNRLYVYWMLYVLNVSIGYLFAKYSILFTANQEYGFVRKIQGFGKIIFQIVQIVFLIKIQSFLLFIIIMIFESLYSYYFYLKHYKKYYSYIIKVTNQEKSIVKDMKNLFCHKIAGLVVYNTDYIILSKFVSLSIVGIYSSYLMICTMAMTIVNVLTPVLAPKIGLFVTKNSKEQIYEYWKKLYVIYIFLATVTIICTYNLLPSFINLWLGKKFLLPNFTIILILINLYIQLIRYVTEMFKNSCGFFDDIYTPVLESILNLFFSLFLVQNFGLNGVIIGTVISNIIVIVFLKPILVFKKCFDKSGIDYIKSSIKLFSLSGLSILLSGLFMKRIDLSFQSIYSWKDLIIKTGILGFISLIMTLVIFLTDIHFKEIILKNSKKMIIKIRLLRKINLRIKN